MSFSLRIISSDMIVTLHFGIKFSTKYKLKNNSNGPNEIKYRKEVPMIWEVDGKIHRLLASVETPACTSHY